MFIRHFLCGADKRIEKYDLDPNAILKHGLCTNKSSGSSCLPPGESFIFMRMGRLYIIPKKRIKNVDRALNVAENELKSSTSSENSVFFLSPQSKVYYVEGTKEIRLSDAECPVPIQCVLNLTLSFPDVNAAREWHETLKIIINFSEFSRELAQKVNNDETIIKSIHDAMWNAMLSFNTNNVYQFIDFYFNQVVNEGIMSSYIHNPISNINDLFRVNEGMVGSTLMYRLFLNIHEMFDENEYPFTTAHGPLVAYSLMRFAQSSVFLRTILLHFRVGADIRRNVRNPDGSDYFSTAKFPHLSHAINESANFSLPMRILHIFLASFPTDLKFQKVILKLLGRDVKDNELSATAVNQQISWENERHYMVDHPLILMHDEFELALKSPKWILYYLLRTKYRDIDPTEFTDIMMQLCRDNLSDEFVIERNGPLQKPFINLIIRLEEDLLRQSIIRSLRDISKINNILFKGFLTEGLDSEHFDETKQFAVSLLFPTDCDNFYRSDFDSYVKNICDAPIVIVKVLHRFLTCTRAANVNDDCCKLLLSFCLRFENCAARGINNISLVSARIKSDPMASLAKEVRDNFSL